jgi:hypothetical protein
MLQSAKQATICDRRGAVGRDRKQLAALYRRRHQRLLKRGMSIDGIAETVQSLSEQDWGVVKLIIVEFPGSKY